MAKKVKDSKPAPPGDSKRASTKARLREHYQKNVVPALTKQFTYKNVMAVPKLEKISINIGLGEATQNATACTSSSTGWLTWR